MNVQDIMSIEYEIRKSMYTCIMKRIRDVNEQANEINEIMLTATISLPMLKESISCNMKVCICYFITAMCMIENLIVEMKGEDTTLFKEALSKYTRSLYKDLNESEVISQRALVKDHCRSLDMKMTYNLWTGSYLLTENGLLCNSQVLVTFKRLLKSLGVISRYRNKRVYPGHSSEMLTVSLEKIINSMSDHFNSKENNNCCGNNVIANTFIYNLNYVLKSHKDPHSNSLYQGQDICCQKCFKKVFDVSPTSLTVFQIEILYDLTSMIPLMSQNMVNQLEELNLGILRRDIKCPRNNFGYIKKVEYKIENEYIRDRTRWPLVLYNPCKMGCLRSTVQGVKDSMLVSNMAALSIMFSILNIPTFNMFKTNTQILITKAVDINRKIMLQGMESISLSNRLTRKIEVPYEKAANDIIDEDELNALIMTL